jgi:hypothetical protein
MFKCKYEYDTSKEGMGRVEKKARPKREIVQPKKFQEFVLIR